MRRFLAQRVMSAALVLVGVSLVVFLALHLAPGDPAQILLGPMATPKELSALREQLGLDQPVLVQFARWAYQVAQGDFGRSIMLRRAVLPEVWRRFHATLILAGAALLLAFPLGVLMGVLSAARRGSRFDRLCQLVALVGVSMPAFWVGLLLIIGFSVRLGWLPGTGMYRPTLKGVVKILAMGRGAVDEGRAGRRQRARMSDRGARAVIVAACERASHIVFVARSDAEPDNVDQKIFALACGRGWKSAGLQGGDLRCQCLGNGGLRQFRRHQTRNNFV